MCICDPKACAHLFVGVDGGGTDTTLVLSGRTGGFLNSVTTESTNWNSVGKETARERLVVALQRLCSSDAPRVHRVVCGMSGVHSEEDRTLVRKWVREVFPESAVLVYNDTVVALASGTAGRPCGIVCINGTGSNCLGIAESGVSVQVGGHGPYLADSCGGVFIGNQTLSSCVRAVDGRGPATSLLEACLRALGLETFEELIPWRYPDTAGKWTQVAGLAMICFEEAAKGDKEAVRIIDLAVEGAVELITTCYLRLQKCDSSASWKRIVLTGSLWKNAEYTAKCMDTVCKALGCDREMFTVPTQSPAFGAVQMAMLPMHKDVN